MRKIIQISNSAAFIYALTDDGKIYKYSNNGTWNKLPDINFEETENEETRKD